MYELCKELESKLITMQIPAFVRTQTDTKLHVPEILYLTHSYADSFEVLVVSVIVKFGENVVQTFCNDLRV